MTDDKRYSRNHVVAMPNGSDDNWGLHLVFQKGLYDYLYCCVNQSSWSFARSEFREDLICQYEYVIYFNDNCDTNTKDEYVWYHLCASQEIGDLLNRNVNIRFCIAVKLYHITSRSLYQSKLSSGEWRRAAIPPHIVYGRNFKNNKYTAFEKYYATSSSDLLREFAQYIGFVKYLPPLMMRLTVEGYFKARPSFKTTLDEREAVARLEMRTQSKFIGKLIGLTILINGSVSKMYRNKDHTKLVRSIISPIFKLLGASTKIEESYNEIVQECEFHDFSPLVAAYMYFLAFPEIRGSFPDVTRYTTDFDLFSSEDFEADESDIIGRYAIFLQLVRQKAITDCEA